MSTRFISGATSARQVHSTNLVKCTKRESSTYHGRRQRENESGWLSAPAPATLNVTPHSRRVRQLRQTCVSLHFIEPIVYRNNS